MTVNFRKYRRPIVITLICVTLIFIYLIRDASKCDKIEQNKLVQDAKGNKIPMYSDTIATESFWELKTKCEYVGDRIDCPDVRHLGKTMIHQSHLVVGRMHAILDLVCKKYKIDYFLNFATLLGARRNNRMLPWDYDGDVGIMIDDYRQLLKYIRKDLPDDLFFQDGSDNPYYKRSPDSKIRDRNSCYGTCLRFGCQWEDGLQLDIFVYRKKKETSSTLVNFFDPAFYKTADILPTTTIEFEGMLLPAPHDVDAVLTSNYGPTFMQAPPKSKGQCSKSGYLAIPWYSCAYLKNLPEEKRKEILRMGMDHGSPWFSFKF